MRGIDNLANLDQSETVAGPPAPNRVTCSYAAAWSESLENQPMISNDVEYDFERSKDRED